MILALVLGSLVTLGGADEVHECYKNRGGWTRITRHHSASQIDHVMYGLVLYWRRNTLDGTLTKTDTAMVNR